MKTTEMRNGFTVTHYGSTEVHTGMEAPADTLYTDVPVARGFWATLDVYQNTPGAGFWNYTLHFYDALGQERGMPATSGCWASAERAREHAINLFGKVAESIFRCQSV